MPARFRAIIAFMEAREKIVPGARFPLEGKRALVVGGTGGIGAELSRALYAQGADLLVHGRSGEKARGLTGSMSGDFPESPSSVTPLEFELGTGRIEEFAAAVKASGRIDILAVSFGPFLRKPLEATGPGEWVSTALLDLALPGALVSACLPGMLASRYGRILLFGGTRTDQIRGFSSNAAYAAAKTGLGSLAKSVALAGAERGVFCTLVCPGLVDTEYLTESAKREWAEKAPGNRLIPARDIALRALSLALDDAGTYNGAVVAMDGGLSFG